LSAPLKKSAKRNSKPKSKKRERISFTNSHDFNVSADSLQHCDTDITPVCLKALYQIPEATTSASPNNSLGLYEYGDTYAQQDLDLFFAKYAPHIPKGTHPIPAFIDGATGPVPVESGGGESDVDMTIALSLIYPQTLTLYQTQVSDLNGYFNTFLDALDGVSVLKRQVDFSLS
jgi:tripeptidyl-peptidase-1